MSHFHDAELPRLQAMTTSPYAGLYCVHGKRFNQGCDRCKAECNSRRVF